MENLIEVTHIYGRPAEDFFFYGRLLIGLLLTRRMRRFLEVFFVIEDL